MEIGLVHRDAQYRARQLAELLHRGQQIRLGRQLAGAADAKRLVDTRHEEDQLHEARALDDIAETVDAVVAGAIGHQEPVRAGDIDKTRIAAARRRIDAAVRTGRGEHAERRHADEFFCVRVDLRPRLGDYARRRFWV